MAEPVSVEALSGHERSIWEDGFSCGQFHQLPEQARIEAQRDHYYRLAYGEPADRADDLSPMIEAFKISAQAIVASVSVFSALSQPEQLIWGDGYTQGLAIPSQALESALADRDRYARAADCPSIVSTSVVTALEPSHAERENTRQEMYAHPVTVQTSNTSPIRPMVRDAHAAAARLRESTSGREFPRLLAQLVESLGKQWHDWATPAPSRVDRAALAVIRAVLQDD